MNRREFAASLAAVIPFTRSIANGAARLRSRMHAPSQALTPGLATLALPDTQFAYLLVPATYVPTRAWPLVVALHGATQRHAMQLRLMSEYAESRGFLLLTMDSQDVTWDGIRGDFGPDLAVIDTALAAVFDRARIDPAHVILEGFSDGASYALALGRANGDLFRRIVAFSPGFIPPSDTPDTGKPAIFISHGLHDPILPIDRAGRRVADELRYAGYYVTFREFDGGHTPLPMAEAAVDWMLRRS